MTKIVICGSIRLKFCFLNINGRNGTLKPLSRLADLPNKSNKMGEPLRNYPQHLNYSDKQLIDGLKSQIPSERELFHTLFYEKYVKYLYKAAVQKSKNFRDAEDLAKDLVQETFIRIFKIINKFDFPPGTPEDQHPFIIKAWLGKIANNCFRQVYSKHIS